MIMLDTNELIHSKRLMLTALLASVSLAGCQTGVVYISPPFHARIVDANSGAPVAGATVSMWSMSESSTKQVARTDNTGHVDLERLAGRMTIALPFVADILPPVALARVEARGYESKDLNSRTDSAQFEGSEPVKLIPTLSER